MDPFNPVNLEEEHTNKRRDVLNIDLAFLQVHGLLHLLGFDHELSEEAEAEMEKEEELLLKSLGWKGKGLIQSAYDIMTDTDPRAENPDGNLTT